MYPYKAMKVKGKRIDEHRLIMQQHLGRELDSDEVVHHKDGNRQNNNLDNLVVMSLSKHSSLHISGCALSKITKQKLQKQGRKQRPNAKLSIEDIPVIRKMLRDKIPQWLISFAYGVKNGTINKINIGKTWAWVENAKPAPANAFHHPPPKLGRPRMAEVGPAFL